MMYEKLNGLRFLFAEITPSLKTDILNQLGYVSDYELDTVFLEKRSIDEDTKLKDVLFELRDLERAQRKLRNVNIPGMSHKLMDIEYEVRSQIETLVQLIFKRLAD